MTSAALARVASRSLAPSLRRSTASSLTKQQYSSSAVSLGGATPPLAPFRRGFPPPRLFDFETVTSNLTVGDAIESVEEAFKTLAKGKVDVPLPMHIGIEESSVAGPGDCHIKGGCECYSYLCLFYVQSQNKCTMLCHAIFLSSPYYSYNQHT